MPRLTAFSQRLLLPSIRIIPFAYGLLDRVSGTSPIGTNLTISSAYTKFAARSLDLPYTAAAGSLPISNATSGMTITVEMWRYLDGPTVDFDFNLEIKANNNNFLFLEDSPIWRGRANGNNWTTNPPAFTWTVGVWNHWVIVWNTTSMALCYALNGTRQAGFITTITGVGTVSAVITELRFRDTQYGGSAPGFVEDVRISNGDIYGLLSGNLSYPVPTDSLSVTNDTLNLYQVLLG